MSSDHGLPRPRSLAPLPGTLLSRRAVLARLGVLSLGAAAAGCSPAAVAGRALYPEAASLDDDTMDRLIAGFAAVVIPEPAVAPEVARKFNDPALRFAPHRGEFTADLMRRADHMAGTERFDRLAPEQRRQIIQAGLDGGAVSSRLYGGAVFLAQIIYYCGLWNETGTCAFIGYEGAYVFPGYDALTYPDQENFFPPSLSADGNPA